MPQQQGAARIATPPPTPAAREKLRQTGAFSQQPLAAEAPQGIALSISPELLQKAENFLGVPSASIRLAKRTDRENAYDINLRGRTMGEYRVGEGRILIQYEAAPPDAKRKVDVPIFVTTLVTEGRTTIFFEITGSSVSAYAADSTGRKQLTLQMR